MVLRSFSNFTKCKSSGFSFSRKASTSHYKFFNPSYIPPNELIDITANTQRGGSNYKKSAFKYIAPGLSVTKNYVVVLNSKPNDQNNENDDDNNLDFDNKIVLKKSASIGNKNSHVNLKVESRTNSHTVINLRRSNSANIKTIVLPNNRVRNYSTKALERDLSNLEIEEQVKTNIETATPEVIQKEANEVLDQIKFIEEDVDTAIINQLLTFGKNNEVLPVFTRMRNNGVVPSIDIYNKVLQAIQLRSTDESSEDKLTHLLNTYSDMLSNGLKPNELTYELVIDSLLQGSLKSYQLNNFQNGYDFFKIALELFLISHNNPTMKFQNNSINLALIKGLVYYKITDVITPEQLYNKLKDKVEEEHLVDFHLLIIEFSAIFKDVKFVNETYSKLQALPKLDLYSNQHMIYSTIIESLNLCGEFDSSYQMFETVVSQLDNEINKETQMLISHYLSIYIKSQASLDPYLAFKTLYNFNSKTWLPDVSIGSLLYLTAMFLRLNNLPMANKVWDFAIIRQDFDSSFKQLNKTEDQYYPLISLVFDQYVELSLLSNDKNQTLKCAREMLIKKSLILNDSSLVKLLSYLQSIEAFDLSVKIVLDQGLKRDKNLNNYLSTIVDTLSPIQYGEIIQSRFFKDSVEQYRLVNDNIYGIMKLLQNIPSSSIDEQLKLKLRYYSKVLNYEFNDVDNCYVQLPQELTDFKSKFIANWC